MLEDDVHGGFSVKIGNTQVALQGVTGESDVLHNQWVIQSHFFTDRFPLILRDGHAHHLLKRVAQAILNGESNHTDHEHDQYGLGNPLNQKR